MSDLEWEEASSPVVAEQNVTTRELERCQTLLRVSQREVVSLRKSLWGHTSSNTRRSSSGLVEPRWAGAPPNTRWDWRLRQVCLAPSARVSTNTLDDSILEVDGGIVGELEAENSRLKTDLERLVGSDPLRILKKENVELEKKNQALEEKVLKLTEEVAGGGQGNERVEGFLRASQEANAWLQQRVETFEAEEKSRRESQRGGGGDVTEKEWELVTLRKENSALRAALSQIPPPAADSEITQLRATAERLVEALQQPQEGSLITPPAPGPAAQPPQPSSPIQTGFIEVGGDITEKIIQIEAELKAEKSKRLHCEELHAGLSKEFETLVSEKETEIAALNARLQRVGELDKTIGNVGSVVESNLPATSTMVVDVDPQSNESRDSYMTNRLQLVTDELEQAQSTTVRLFKKVEEMEIEAEKVKKEREAVDQVAQEAQDRMKKTVVEAEERCERLAGEAALVIDVQRQVKECEIEKTKLKVEIEELKATLGESQGDLEEKRKEVIEKERCIQESLSSATEANNRLVEAEEELSKLQEEIKTLEASRQEVVEKWRLTEGEVESCKEIHRKELAALQRETEAWKAAVTPPSLEDEPSHLQEEDGLSVIPILRREVLTLRQQLVASEIANGKRQARGRVEGLDKPLPWHERNIVVLGSLKEENESLRQKLEELTHKYKVENRTLRVERKAAFTEVKVLKERTNTAELALRRARQGTNKDGPDVLAQWEKEAEVLRKSNLELKRELLGRNLQSPMITLPSEMSLRSHYEEGKGEWGGILDDDDDNVKDSTPDGVEAVEMVGEPPAKRAKAELDPCNS